MTEEKAKTLFEITEDKLETGLRGCPVGYCPTSQVHPTEGLSYGGYKIAELANREPEEVIYLLLYRKLPEALELEFFKRRIIEHSEMNPLVYDSLRAMPKGGHPMKWFMNGINLLGMREGKNDYEKDALTVIAQIPALVAAIYRIRSGWGDPIRSRPELGYMENFAYMLGVPDASPHMERLMRVFNILHYDHGGGNLSTFVGKAVASGHECMFGSLVASMAGLAGPLHGMANQECLNFLMGSLDKIGNPEDDETTLKYVKKLYNTGNKIYGFGHAVLRVEDPRATVLFELGDEICPDDQVFKMAKSMRTVASEFLKKQPKINNPYPNVDSVSGSLFRASGLLDESYYTVLFGMSRCVGIAAQIVYERTQARDGKGTPIIRPKYIYSGPKR